MYRHLFQLGHFPVASVPPESFNPCIFKGPDQEVGSLLHLKQVPGIFLDRSNQGEGESALQDLLYISDASVMKLASVEKGSYKNDVILRSRSWSFL